ncbi:MAG: type II secretion system protein [Halanaerobiaceae bacterium]
MKINTVILKDKKGFTLVELMIVIGIMGILAGIIMPKLNGVNEKAENAAIAGLASSLRTSMEIFYNEHSAYPEYNKDINSESVWDDLDKILDLMKLGDKELYNVKSIHYQDNSQDTETYLIKFISSDDSEYYLGEKSFQNSKNVGLASDLTISE